MNKQQFEALKVGDEVIFNHTTRRVAKIYDIVGILELVDGGYPIRYENCELVEQDRLLAYLTKNYIKDNPTLGEAAQEIRKICREEFVRDLKFPSYEAFCKYQNDHHNLATFNFFIEQVKTLNK